MVKSWIIFILPQNSPCPELNMKYITAPTVWIKKEEEGNPGLTLIFSILKKDIKTDFCAW